MKKTCIYVFSILFFLLINVCPAKAQRYSARSRIKYLKTHSGEVDLKLLDFTYKEPDVGVKDSGEMLGIGMAYTYHNNHNNLMLKAALDYYTGKIDYESESGKLNNVSHYVLDTRWLIGRDLLGSNYQPSYCVTPYTGIGFRHWKDDSGGKITDLGYYGYDRITTYFYSPFGFEIINISEYKWSIGVLMEYDFLWKGKNKSHLSDVDPVYPDLEFDQDSGYGLRFDLKVERAFNKVKIGIAPFIHYWHINKSEELRFYDPSDPSYLIFFEPKNNTTEFGGRFSVRF